MRPLARFGVIAVVAGSGMALGLTLLAPAVEGVATAGSAKATDVQKLAEVAENSAVYSSDGRLLAVLHAEENRSPVKLSQVPDRVVNAILDVEDERFWTHGGVNLSSTLRALAANVSSGEVVQGGSTITQQLVKNALLTPEKSVDRKVKEAVLAVRLEDQLSKKEILERYLNIVYFGNGAYGVQAAAETYFNTTVENLDAGQAALLAGVIRNPQGYDPLKRPDKARARRDFALSRMVKNGHLTAAQEAGARREPIPAKVFTPLPAPQDYFVEEVKQRLLDDKRLGETAQERYNAVFKGGLRIETTLDPQMQQEAEAARAKVLPNSITKGRFTSALVTVEPDTGYVRAMIAGDDFGTAKYNLATQGKRQPGSSFKPFVLLAALENGFSPNDTINGSCGTLTIPGFAPYTPGNYEGSGGGVMTITQATTKSVNCAYARLGVMVGLDKVVDMAARLGIPRDRLHAYPSISLGAQEVTPLEMAAAYSTIANDGVYHPPSFIEKVTDRNGKVLFEGPAKGRRVVSAQVARLAQQVMMTVVEKGTGTAARLPGREVAGKTGTSQEWQNAWFVGYTPQLTTAIWMGSPVGNVPMKGVGGRNVTGGSYPARIFGAYMAEALQGKPAIDFTAPEKAKAGKYLRDKYSKDDAPPRHSRSTGTTTDTTEPDLPVATEGVQPAPTQPPAPAPTVVVPASP
ncbi:MAG TPA: PBP1A family penicillin-binding protein [Acidimicrobiales bacterium]|nr:PBP1A family penicillin-binding protein [Acidimicrobiales bacterium]